MRPYLAIIKDSFREAMGSRVLWVLLLLITALLIGLIPFHWRSSIAAEMIGQDIRNIRHTSNALKAGAEADSAPLMAHVWNSLSGRTQKRITELSSASGPRAIHARDNLAQELNKVISRDDFYRDELWADAKLSPRAEELLERSTLDDDSRKQLNRLALEAALPGQLRPCPEEAMTFRYAKWDMDFVPPFGRKFAVEIIDKSLLAFMAVFVGFFGIFAGVLVTAPIIPNMLDSGSLYVLISKPISRPLLFLAKFVGGCSFVFINAAYLIVGLCLILGVRFGIWKPQLLWSIPLFLFSFAIFYSVSALSGLVWRSTVMAIVATIMFWFLCTTVGSTKGILEQLVIVPDEISSIVQHDDNLFVTRRSGDVAVWNPTTQALDEVFQQSDSAKRQGPEMIIGRGSSFVGMVYDPTTERLLVLDKKWSQGNILTGSKTSGWSRETKVAAPNNASGLFLHKGQLVVVADEGIFQVSTTVADEEGPLGINIFGLKIAEAVPTQHTNVSEGLDKLPADARIAYDQARGDIFVHGSRTLRRIGEEGGVFREVGQTEIELKEVTEVSAQGGVVAIANRDEEIVRIHILDGDSLELKRELNTKKEEDVRRLAVSDDGRWIACLFENDELILYDLETDIDGGTKSIPSQGSIKAVRFSSDAVMIADANDRVRTLSLPEMKTQKTLNPQLPMIRRVYRFLVNPLYLVCPKPAELQNTMRYAITGKDTEKVEGLGPGVRTVKLDPWQPLVSNSVFIGVMLMAGCWYVYRQDF